MSAEDDLCAAMSKISLSRERSRKDSRRKLKRKRTDAVSTVDNASKAKSDCKGYFEPEKYNFNDFDTSTMHSRTSGCSSQGPSNRSTGVVYVFPADEPFELPEEPVDESRPSDDEEQRPPSPFKKVVIKVPALVTPESYVDDNEGGLEDCDIPVGNEQPSKPNGRERRKSKRQSYRLRSQISLRT